jgi:hypothetical protein
VADGDGLENHCGSDVTVGSNPTPSARPRKTGPDLDLCPLGQRSSGWRGRCAGCSTRDGRRRCASRACPTRDRWPSAGRWLLDQLWQWLGIGAILAARLGKTRRDAAAERVLLNLEVDLLFFDTTSTYFEVDEEDGAVPRDKNGSVTGDEQKAAEGKPAGFRAYGKLLTA